VGKGTPPFIEGSRQNKWERKGKKKVSPPGLRLEDFPREVAGRSPGAIRAEHPV